MTKVKELIDTIDICCDNEQTIDSLIYSLSEFKKNGATHVYADYDGLLNIFSEREETPKESIDRQNARTACREATKSYVSAITPLLDKREMDSTEIMHDRTLVTFFAKDSNEQIK